MNGYELADAMRAGASNPHARYLALTGFGQQFDKDRSALAGFAAHLVKPVDLQKLVALL
jgi:CheY-like chemotaxis protein